MVGAAGIEPATTCSQSRYATAALRPAGGDYPTHWLVRASLVLRKESVLAKVRMCPR